MRNRNINFSAAAWMTFAGFLGAVLAVRGVRALLGLAPFAWWHLPLLAASIFFALEELTPESRAYLAALYRLTRIQAARSFSNKSRRAVRGLAALFTTHQHPKIQTEP